MNRVYKIDFVLLTFLNCAKDLAGVLGTSGLGYLLQVRTFNHVVMRCAFGISSAV
jgi:hypothetical protein